MGIIKVTTENVTSQASKVEDKASEYMNHYLALLDDVSTMTSTDWTGEDATAFKTQIEGFREDFVKMKGLMDEYAAFMKKAATTYEETKDLNIQQIKSLQN